MIGGQMVLLHALEHGTLPAVVSQDGDALADVRAQPGTLAALTARLRERGFVAVQAPGPAAPRAHRFELDAPVTPVVPLINPDRVKPALSLLAKLPPAVSSVTAFDSAIAVEPVVARVPPFRSSGPPPRLPAAEIDTVPEPAVPLPMTVPPL